MVTKDFIVRLELREVKLNSRREYVLCWEDEVFVCCSLVELWMMNSK
jgi:hypothetical protein